VNSQQQQSECASIQDLHDQSQIDGDSQDYQKVQVVQCDSLSQSKIILDLDESIDKVFKNKASKDYANRHKGDLVEISESPVQRKTFNIIKDANQDKLMDERRSRRKDLKQI